MAPACQIRAFRRNFWHTHANELHVRCPPGRFTSPLQNERRNASHPAQRMRREHTMAASGIQLPPRVRAMARLFYRGDAVSLSEYATFNPTVRSLHEAGGGELNVAGHAGIDSADVGAPPPFRLEEELLI